MKEFYDGGGRSEADYTGAEHLANMQGVNDIKTTFRRSNNNGEHVELHYRSKILGLDYYVILYYKLKKVAIVSLKYDVPNDDIFLAIISGIILNSHGVFENLTLLTLGNYKKIHKERSYFLAAIYKFTYEFSVTQLRKIKRRIKILKIADEDKENLFNLQYLLYTDSGVNVWIKIGFESRTSFSLLSNSKNIQGLQAMLKIENKEYFLPKANF